MTREKTWPCGIIRTLRNSPDQCFIFPGNIIALLFSCPGEDTTEKQRYNVRGRISNCWGTTGKSWSPGLKVVIFNKFLLIQEIFFPATPAQQYRHSYFNFRESAVGIFHTFVNQRSKYSWKTLSGASDILYSVYRESRYHFSLSFHFSTTIFSGFIKRRRILISPFHRSPHLRHCLVNRIVLILAR